MFNVLYSATASDAIPTEHINRFASVFAPLLFTYVIVFNLFGNKFSMMLMKRDTCLQKEIKLRPYSIVKTSATAIVLLISLLYFLWHRDWMVSVLITVFALGYAFIRIEVVYSIKVQYSQNYLYYQKWDKKYKIAMSNIVEMYWSRTPGDLGEILEILLQDGSTICLSSSDFFGVFKLKNTYDKYISKGQGDGSPVSSKADTIYP